MNLLLDTHAVLWWFYDDPMLPQRARRAIADPEREVFVSSASAWEIATKHRLGKMPAAGDVVRNFGPLVRKARMTELPVTIEHALAAGALPGPHRDPFDRMLIAQSRIEKLAVVTSDPVFARYSVKVIW